MSRVRLEAASNTQLEHRYIRKIYKVPSLRPKTPQVLKGENENANYETSSFLRPPYYLIKWAPTWLVSYE